MAKNLNDGVLLDFYGELLTEKQQTALDMYYNQDLSLAEIAEEMEVSRQGARAIIKQGEAHLQNFEEKLGLAERFSEISRLTLEIREILLKMPKSSEQEEVAEKIEEITTRL